MERGVRLERDEAWKGGAVSYSEDQGWCMQEAEQPPKRQTSLGSPPPQTQETQALSDQQSSGHGSNAVLELAPP